MDLPKYISYVPATETRGDYFAIEIKYGGAYVLRKKTSQNKSMSADDKLNEAKTILVTELHAHPEWNISHPLLYDTTIVSTVVSHKTLPSGVTSLPKYVRYVKSTGTRGDGFEYEKKSSDGSRIVHTSSRSKAMSLDDKYNELLSKLKAVGVSV